MNISRTRFLPFALLALPFTMSPINAQTFDFSLNAASSSTNFDANFGLDLPGTVIGDFDAVDNPGGTTTLPGFFGGSGNNPINLDLGVGVEVDFMGVPSGVFRMDISTDTLAVEVSGLALDLLGGATVEGPLNLGLLYDTFRTTNPNAVFIGGFPINLPLGNTSISDLQIEQSGASLVGVLIPGFAPGEYSFTVLVPVDFSLTIDFLGTPTPVGPLPLVLPLVGQVVLDAGGAAVTIAFDQAANQTLSDPLGGFELDNIPFPLPTILPPGGTANLLLSATIGSIDIGVDLSAMLVADGVAPCGFSNFCTANVNSAGLTASLDIDGSPLIADGDLTLSASNLPTNVWGFYLMSPVQGMGPLGSGSEGFLCLGLPCYRLRNTTSNSGPTGAIQSSLDFGNLPEGQIFTAGSTWNFQLWYRDKNPGPTSNTSPGATVMFCN